MRHGAVTTQRPRGDARNHGRPERIQHHVPRPRQQISIAFQQNRLGPPLEQVADQAMAAIALQRINAIQLRNCSPQIGIRRFHR